MITKLETYHLYMYFKALKAKSGSYPEEKKGTGNKGGAESGLSGRLFFLREKPPLKVPK